MECDRKNHATFDVKSIEEEDLMVLDEEKYFDEEKKKSKEFLKIIAHC